MKQQKKNNLILIGFMGCGKTSVGIKLSYRLKQTFLDTDKQIERKAGKSISEIFAQDGEDAFRQMETDFLRELLIKNDTGFQIFSTGGGTPVREENRELLKQLGTVIYLKASPAVIYERLKGDTTRPLLQTEDPKARIAELMAAREEAYALTADVVLTVDDKSPEEIVEKLQEIVRINKAEARRGEPNNEASCN